MWEEQTLKAGLTMLSSKEIQSLKMEVSIIRRKLESYTRGKIKGKDVDLRIVCI